MEPGDKNYLIGVAVLLLFCAVPIAGLIFIFLRSLGKRCERCGDRLIPYCDEYICDRCTRRLEDDD